MKRAEQNLGLFDPLLCNRTDRLNNTYPPGSEQKAGSGENIIHRFEEGSTIALYQFTMERFYNEYSIRKVTGVGTDW